MNPQAQTILDELAVVERLRAERAADPALAARTLALKTYQATRFERSYADLLATPRYAGAARFFLEELYGPHEFSARDAQFARIVPTLVRMFPHEIVETVATLATLHALSESLDSAMACRLPELTLRAADYVRAWQRTGQPEQRRRQIDLTMAIGRALDRYTRNPVLRGALRMMRRPARAAGLGDLQRFLECGFETFGAMHGAQEFLEIVEQRERAFADALFTDQAVTSATALSSEASRLEGGALGQLP